MASSATCSMSPNCDHAGLPCSSELVVNPMIQQLLDGTPYEPAWREAMRKLWAKTSTGPLGVRTKNDIVEVYDLFRLIGIASCGPGGDVASINDAELIARSVDSIGSLSILGWSRMENARDILLADPQLAYLVKNTSLGPWNISTTGNANIACITNKDLLVIAKCGSANHAISCFNAMLLASCVNAVRNIIDESKT